MLDALGVADLADDDHGGLLLVCRPPSPRALDTSFIVKAAIELGIPEDHIEVVDRVEDAVSTALLATPPDGQIVITGSLYVVGAARSVLVS